MKTSCWQEQWKKRRSPQWDWATVCPECTVKGAGQLGYWDTRRKKDGRWRKAELHWCVFLWVVLLQVSPKTCKSSFHRASSSSPLPWSFLLLLSFLVRFICSYSDFTFAGCCCFSHLLWLSLFWCFAVLFFLFSAFGCSLFLLSSIVSVFFSHSHFQYACIWTFSSWMVRGCQGLCAWRRQIESALLRLFCCCDLVLVPCFLQPWPPSFCKDNVR